jgi:hypothetical protein
MSESFHVYFKSGTCDMEAAVRSLTKSGLTVRRDRESVVVGRSPGGGSGKSGSPEFRIDFSMESWVKEEAIEIGEGTDYEIAMGDRDARFEVSFEDLDEALDEINTMIEVQVGLQEVCDGILFLTWNGGLSSLEG